MPWSEETTWYHEFWGPDPGFSTFLFPLPVCPSSRARATAPQGCRRLCPARPSSRCRASPLQPLPPPRAIHRVAQAAPLAAAFSRATHLQAAASAARRESRRTGCCLPAPLLLANRPRALTLS